MVSPEAWTAIGGMGLAAITLVDRALTRRSLQRVEGRVDEVAQTTEEARSEASTAARQTVATGNGHASRVEGGLQQVLDRTGRVEELIGDVRGEMGAELRGMRKDIAEVRRAITDHLQDHAGANVRRVG